MTIAWAIVIVAVLYFLDKHHLLKKSLIGAGIAVAVIALGYAILLGYQQVKTRLEDHQFAKLEYQRFAKLHDCYNPSNGKTHPPNEARGCAAGEELIEWGTPQNGNEFVPNPDYHPQNSQDTSSADTYNTPNPAGATALLQPPPPGSKSDRTPDGLSRYHVYKANTREAVYLMSLFNDYLAAPNTLPANFFSQQMGNEFVLLEKWDRSYYRSKFIVLLIDKAPMGGNLISILFLDKPDTLFTAWVYTLSGGESELRGFDSAGLTEKEMVKVRDIAANHTP